MRVPAVIGGILETDQPPQIECVGNVARDADVQVTIHDTWHIGSCAKSMTAALCARLAELGELEWTTPIDQCFPDIAGVHKDWQRRSLRDVLHCIAGVRANPTLAHLTAGYKDHRPLTAQRSDLAQFALARPPKPAKFVYSNLGYIVVGAALDRISRQPFEHTINHHLFEPLGMSSVGYGAPERVCGHHPRLRIGPLLIGRGKPAEPDGQRSDNPPVLSSAGTLHMTMQDWAKFLQLFISPANDLLSKDSLDALLTLPEHCKSPMTMGWAVADLPGVSFGMQGSNTMWSACALLNKSRTRAAFVVINDGRTSVISASPYLTQRLLNSEA